MQRRSLFLAAIVCSALSFVGCSSDDPDWLPRDDDDIALQRAPVTTLAGQRPLGKTNFAIAIGGLRWIGVEGSLNQTVPAQGALADDIGVFRILG